MLMDSDSIKAPAATKTQCRTPRCVALCAGRKSRRRHKTGEERARMKSVIYGAEAGTSCRKPVLPVICAARASRRLQRSLQKPSLTPQEGGGGGGGVELLYAEAVSAVQSEADSAPLCVRPSLPAW